MATGKKSSSARRLTGLGRETAETVRRASDVLEGELAASIVAAKKAGERFRRERKLDAADLQEALGRFRADGHELVDAVREMTEELRSAETDALTQRLLRDAHDTLDTVVDLVTLAPDLVNRLLRMAGNAAAAADGAAGRRTGSPEVPETPEKPPAARARRRRTAS
jgi:methyl-accepting chemotaxis protein